MKVNFNVCKQSVSSPVEYLNSRPIEHNISTNNKYEDPLARMPLRLLAYSNDVGMAISGIAPKLGAALWAPALMYFGANIYDKYKNENNVYNPSKTRGIKEVVFQGLASVSLPAAAIHIGQSTISGLSRLLPDKLSINAKIEVQNFIIDFINKSKLSSYDGKFDKYKSLFSSFP